MSEPMSEAGRASARREERDLLGAVAVLGAGVMGRGIGAHLCRFAERVTLYEPDLSRAEEGHAAALNSLERAQSRGKISAEEAGEAGRRLAVSDEVSRAVEGCALVIEAAPERLELKQALLLEAESALAPSALLASNTSSLSISRLAAGLTRPERFLGMHFFNPVPVMQLLELVHGERTGADTLEEARALAAQIDKVPIVVRDSPGFATSRLGIALGNEAARMLAEGVASAEDIDRAMVLGYRHPIGPLALGDLVGLDTRLAISEYLYKELGSEVFNPPQMIRDLVAAGSLGRKSGRGFYEY